MTKASTAKTVYKYIGQDREGLLRLRSQKEDLFVCGELHAASKPTEGNTKVALVALKTTPNYIKANSDQQFSVVTNTGEHLRIVGTVVSQPSTISVTKRRVITVSPKEEKSVAAPEAHAKKIRGGKKPSGDALLKEEVNRVNALLKLGHDPEVRMRYASYFIGQSEGNLYKKIKAGTFPAPYSKSGGAFWKHSTLTAYQTDTSQP